MTPFVSNIDLNNRGNFYLKLLRCFKNIEDFVLESFYGGTLYSGYV